MLYPAAEHGIDAVLRACGKPIVYRRSTGEEYHIHALQGKSAWRGVEYAGTMQKAGIMKDAAEFILRRSVLGFDPQKGDTIQSGKTVWTVRPFRNSDCWRFMHPEGDFIRISCIR